MRNIGPIRWWLPTRTWHQTFHWVANGRVGILLTKLLTVEIPIRTFLEVPRRSGIVNIGGRRRGAAGQKSNSSFREHYVAKRWIWKYVRCKLLSSRFESVVCKNGPTPMSLPEWTHDFFRSRHSRLLHCLQLKPMDEKLQHDLYVLDVLDSLPIELFYREPLALDNGANSSDVVVYDVTTA